MGAGGATAVVDAVWSQQSVWSQTADLLKARIGRMRSLMLGLAVASAVLTTLAAQVATLNESVGKALVLAAGTALGLVPLVRARLGRDAVGQWTRARSVAEALKAETYSYLAGVTPFRGDDRQAVLAERTGKVLADAGSLLHHTLGVVPEARGLPAVHDADSYVENRLEPQIAWYEQKAHRMAYLLAWARRVEWALGALGALLAALAAVRGRTEAAAWVAVVTTATAAVSAHVAASRWEYQLVEYVRTGGELVRLRDGWPRMVAHDEAGADRFVERCEQVVSAQNEAWMAKWATEEA